MAIGNDPSAIILATDTVSLDALRLKAKTDPKGAIKETARQFEGLLMNVMLKSMRETVASDGLFDSEQTKLYTSMLDQHLSQAMSKRGLGLAAVLERQLMAVQTGNPEAATPNAGAQVVPRPSTTGAAPDAAITGAAIPAAAPAATSDAARRARAFVEQHAADARAASQTSGIPARFMLGQAALESGWGAAEIRSRDGAASHNLFGIKAGADWKGRTVETTTTEFENGVAQKKTQSFRAYDSYRDAFRDYADFLATNPRYSAVVNSAQNNSGDVRAFARGLQDAGYATDPHYADKLGSVIDSQAVRTAKPG
ncbi:MAG: flagellar assembly peptidoglycan hydrolase FlgJ [Betaproteobacteria bacterium]